jgi:hypothetical protein
VVNADESTAVLAYFASACGRDVKPGEAGVWYSELRDVPMWAAQSAVRQAIRKDGWKDLGTVLAAVQELRAENVRYVGGARARGLVPKDWPMNRFLPDAVREQVIEQRRQEFAGTNDAPDQIEGGYWDAVKAIEGVKLKDGER